MSSVGENSKVGVVLVTAHATYVIETKRRRRITAEVIPEMKEKLRRLRLDRSRSVRTALVYHRALERGIEGERFFDFLIPFGELLHPPAM